MIYENGKIYKFVDGLSNIFLTKRTVIVFLRIFDGCLIAPEKCFKTRIPMRFMKVLGNAG